MSEHSFGRLITAMITPFKENLDLDLDRTEELADRLVKGGTDSIIVCGTTGESPTVFYPQKIEVIKAVVRAVDGRWPAVLVRCAAKAAAQANSAYVSSRDWRRTYVRSAESGPVL